MDERDSTVEVDVEHASYGSLDSEDGKSKSIQKDDISDIKSYFKHRRTRAWGKMIQQELWAQKILIVLLIIIEIVLLLVGLLDDDWSALSWQAWVSIEITVLTLAMLIANYFPPGFVFLTAMTLCYALNIIDSDEAFEGFSNTGVITVGVLVRNFFFYLFIYIYFLKRK